MQGRLTGQLDPNTTVFICGRSPTSESVSQVSWNNLGSGLVVITVAGFNIPKPPQNYSLVVQGSFTGRELQTT